VCCVSCEGRLHGTRRLRPTAFTTFNSLPPPPPLPRRPAGSTGKPKGVAHTSAGYLLFAAMTQKYIFDYRPGDVYACVADCGWITGHTYIVYGPLVNGATTLMFESTPMYPGA
jgi:non-ribosomal peptide synthetase component F